MPPVDDDDEAADDSEPMPAENDDASKPPVPANQYGPLAPTVV